VVTDQHNLGARTDPSAGLGERPRELRARSAYDQARETSTPRGIDSREIEVADTPEAASASRRHRQGSRPLA
jgi:hypothetical protein